MDEAILMGATINEYNSFLKYVDSLNTTKAPLNLPQNAFLTSFIQFDSESISLNITREKALRAGASIQGYVQLLEYIKSLNSSMSDKDFEGFKDYISKAQNTLLEYAKKNPGKSAVQEIYQTPNLK